MEWEDCPCVLSNTVEGGSGWLSGGMNACRLARVRNWGGETPAIKRPSCGWGCMGGENLCEIVWNERIVRAYFPIPLKAGAVGSLEA